MTRPDGTQEQPAGRGDAAGPGPGTAGPAAEPASPSGRMPFGAGRFARGGSSDVDEPPVVIRDKRRVSSEASGDVAASAEPAASSEPSELDVDLNAVALAERTADLQRLQAEYANYRKRADRERLAAADVAIAGVAASLLPVLDDIERARQHGDLTGAFKSVADQLDAVLSKLGLVAFGEPGDPFDPAIHEAVLHDESDTVSVPTASSVMRPGYRFGERLVRPAMVGVTDPSGPVPAAEPQPDALADDAEDIGI